eukprot:245216-Pelagomonas_calceolata.AAC.3
MAFCLLTLACSYSTTRLTRPAPAFLARIGRCACLATACAVQLLPCSPPMPAVQARNPPPPSPPPPPISSSICQACCAACGLCFTCAGVHTGKHCRQGQPSAAPSAKPIARPVGCASPAQAAVQRAQSESHAARQHAHVHSEHKHRAKHATLPRVGLILHGTTHALPQAHTRKGQQLQALTRCAFQRGRLASSATCAAALGLNGLGSRVPLIILAERGEGRGLPMEARTRALPGSPAAACLLGTTSTDLMCTIGPQIQPIIASAGVPKRLSVNCAGLWGRFDRAARGGSYRYSRGGRQKRCSGSRGQGGVRTRAGSEWVGKGTGGWVRCWSMACVRLVCKGELLQRPALDSNASMVIILTRARDWRWRNLRARDARCLRQGWMGIRAGGGRLRGRLGGSDGVRCEEGVGSGSGASAAVSVPPCSASFGLADMAGCMGSKGKQAEDAIGS